MSTSILSVRVSEEERKLLEAASEQARSTLSDFVRRKALEAAEMACMDRRIISIPAKDWEKFEAWARSPGKALPGLKKRLRKKPTWQA